MDARLSALLAVDNPWLEDPERKPDAFAGRVPSTPVPRHVPGLERWPVARHAHLVVGPRRAGKTTLIWLWCRSRGQPPLLLNAEEPAIREWSASPALAARDLEALVGPEVPILLDEAQRLPEAGLFVKGLIDRALPNPLFVTGSSSFHLLAKTRESLAGRAVRAVLHPFSLAELGATLPPAPAALKALRLRELALRHAVVGGYPDAWLAAEPRPVLEHLVEGVVLRDASDFFRVQHLDAFHKLLRLVAGQVGSLVNLSEWAGICGVARATIAGYLDLLVETHLVHLVTPFVGGRRAEVTGRPKVFVVDGGVRGVLVNALQPFDDRPDRGPVLENWVAGELLKRQPALLGPGLRYWRSTSGAEVDFVLAGDDGLTGVEVKATPLHRPALSRSARSFIDAYRPGQFVVVNLALEHEETLGATRVRWVGPEWLAGPLEDYALKE